VPVLGNGRQMLQPIFISDLVKIAINSLDKGHKKLIVDIAGPDRVSLSELVMMIANKLKRRIFIVHIPYLFIKLSTKLIFNINKRRIYLDKINLLSIDKVTDTSNMNDSFSLNTTRLSKGIKLLINS
jgi:nucleoside-diphosphate-sugar epimerase